MALISLIFAKFTHYPTSIVSKLSCSLRALGHAKLHHAVLLHPSGHKPLYNILFNYRLNPHTEAPLKNIIFVGYGYVAKHVSTLEKRANTSLFALTRDPRKCSQLRIQGIDAIEGDLDGDCDLGALPLPGSGIYYFAPPPGTGTQDPRMDVFLNALGVNTPPRRIVYISTTGVYSTPTSNILIHEDSPTQPTVGRGQRRLDAEKKLLTWSKKHPQCRVIILRVSGIYGPDKLPLERIKRAEPVLDNTNPSYVNLIHIEDLARVCFQAMRKNLPRTIYNVSDGHPLLMSEYFQSIARAFNYPAPPFISMAEAEKRLSANFLSYLKESRKIDNTKMRHEFNIELHHPDAHEAINAMAETTNHKRN